MSEAIPPPGVSPVYVLAGGSSRRFGSDKAFADDNGIPRTVAIASRWASRSADSVTAIGRRADAFAAWGLRTIVDPPAHAGEGPMAGLLAALLDRNQSRGPGWLLLVACDTSEIDPAAVDPLPQPPAATALASVFRDAEPPRRFQPLPARWHTDLLPAVRAHLGRGERSLQSLLRHAPVVEVPTPPGLAAAAARGNHPD